MQHKAPRPSRASGRPLRNICVYCGSGPGTNPAFMQAASAFGQALAENDIGLVFGGGGRGLMGEVARATLGHGGHVVGIIPKFLFDAEHALEDVDELLVTQSMHERKLRMFERSDAFVALPGGIGTLEEFVEQMTWNQIGQHDKPLVLANVAGYWDPLIELFDHMLHHAFIRPGLDVRYHVIDNVRDVIPALARIMAAQPRAEEPDEAVPLEKL
jgi:uncharacterized protein (TIGR00730 family)